MLFTSRKISVTLIILTLPALMFAFYKSTSWAPIISIVLGLSLLLDLAFGRLAYPKKAHEEMGAGVERSGWQTVVFGLCGLALIAAGLMQVNFA